MRKDIYNEVKRLKTMDIKINCSDLAKRMGCDPRTVKSYADGKIKEERKKTSSKSKLDDFKSIVEDKVDNYSASATSIFNFIKKKGYQGEYGLVKKYVAEHKKTQLKKATIRFETTPGLQAQVDYKEKLKMVSRSGETFKINIFLYVLGYSRFKYIELSIDKAQNSLFNCLINAFKSSNGIPQEILFDNMATVVNRHNTFIGKVEYNEKFSQFSKDFNFTPVACRPYRPQTKGKVEALAKLMNRLAVQNGEFDTLEELKQIIEALNVELNNEISQATNMTPVAKLKEEEPYLKAIPNNEIIDSYTTEIKMYKVSKESMITILGNKYSVPVSFIGKKVRVDVLEKENILKISLNGDLITSHKISKGIFNYHKEHAVEILKSDAFKDKITDEIEEIVQKNLDDLDLLLVGVTKWAIIHSY